MTKETRGGGRARALVRHGGRRDPRAAHAAEQLVDCPRSARLLTGNSLGECINRRGHDWNMTETPESRTAPRYDDDRYGRPNRLNQVLAWVGIVAGVVFVVAVVFFSGFFIGRSTGHHYGGHHGYWQHGQMTGPGGMMGPGQTGPSGPMGPQPSPTTTAPSTPRP